MKRFLLIFFTLFTLAGMSVAADLINLNTASHEQLETLPGVGPNKANAIMEHRTKVNGFKTIDELDDVKGFSEKTVEKVRALVTVGAVDKGQ